MEDIILRTENICKFFDNNCVLDHVNFSCKLGEVVGLLGENGAGKSTLMRIISGVIQPTSGDIYVSGKKTSFKNIREAQNCGITIIHQEFNLIPYLTVAENVFLGRQPLTKLKLIDYNKMNQEVKDLSQKLEIQIEPEAIVSNLTVAQQQMVEIMKALNVKADVIIMDEPTAALSQKEVKALFKIIQNLKNHNKLIIFISHRLNEVFEICERVIVLRDGKNVGEMQIAGTTRDQVVDLMVGRKIDNIFPHHENSQEEEAEPLLEIKNMVVKYGAKGASFQVFPGEILGITGLEGQGQREIIRSIFGLYHPFGGKVFYKGQELKISNPKAVAKAGISFLTDDRKVEGLCLDLPVSENICLPVLNKGNFITKDFLSKRSQTYIDLLKIKTASLASKVKSLSGGNQQKVALAKCLIVNPSLILMDEPTRGVDVAAKIEIYELMQKLADEGVAIIMVSSDMMEILNISNRILTVFGGEITGELSSGDASEETVMRYSMGIS